MQYKTYDEASTNSSKTNKTNMKAKIFINLLDFGNIYKLI